LLKHSLFEKLVNLLDNYKERISIIILVVLLIDLILTIIF